MIKKIAVVLILVLGTTACSGLNDRQQRAVTGGAIGAGGGAVIGLIAGAPLLGAVVGGAAGTAAGALMDKGINQ